MTAHPPAQPTADDRPSRARRGWRAATRVEPPIAGVAGCLILWWAIVEGLDVAPYLVPAPPAVLDAMRAWPGYLASHGRVTLTEALAGFALALLTALPVGAVLATSRWVYAAAMPSLLALNAIPKPALAPVLLATMGFGIAPKVVLVWLMALFTITLATATGLRQTPAELVELSQALCATRLRTVWKIRLPAALPHLFVGVQQALPLALIGAVVAELFGGAEGLGFVIANAGTNADLAFAAIAILAAMSITLHQLANLAQTVIAPWIHRTTN